MNICIVGLGYVGLPLAVAFGKQQPTLAFDINEDRIYELQKGQDRTKEVSASDLALADLSFSADPTILRKADVIIVAVPTPVDATNTPNLQPLLSASKLIGAHMKKGSIVVYESTVYPGCTEEDCVPVLEEASGMRYKQDFFVGYSPERINPGDKQHGLENVVKVVAGCDEHTLSTLASLYEQVVEAGVHRAPSIKVAEAAKIIENTQRDINIALMNELKMIFDKAGIRYEDVLAAAQTKWNFLPFTPGLVGGHCIGVDPYYLAFKAKQLGQHTEMILAGRRINDDMAKYEASNIIKHLAQEGKTIKGAQLLILGATFKPNVPDTRNSKVKDLAQELTSYGCVVTLCEPHVQKDTLFGFPNVQQVSNSYDLVIKAVPHEQFATISVDYTLF